MRRPGHHARSTADGRPVHSRRSIGEYPSRWDREHQACLVADTGSGAAGLFSTRGLTLAPAFSYDRAVAHCLRGDGGQQQRRGASAEPDGGIEVQMCATAGALHSVRGQWAAGGPESAAGGKARFGLGVWHRRRLPATIDPRRTAWVAGRSNRRVEKNPSLISGAQQQVGQARGKGRRPMQFPGPEASDRREKIGGGDRQGTALSLQPQVPAAGTAEVPVEMGQQAEGLLSGGDRRSAPNDYRVPVVGHPSRWASEQKACRVAVIECRL